LYQKWRGNHSLWANLNILLLVIHTLI
jgi:hypothetical protein